jgi:choice-of-anchor C domain-containing protein
MSESGWLRAVTLCGSLYFGWLLQPPTYSENLAVNGSFEIRAAGQPNNYIDTLTPDREDLVGWQVTGKSVDWIGPDRWKASHGEHCLDIDAPGGIRQTIQTTPGRAYQLQFDLAGNVETEPLAKVLRVSINGQQRDFSFDAAGHTRQQLGWVRQQIVFTARGDKTTLCFSNASPTPTASGAALDNVVVAEVKPDRYTVRITEKGTVLIDISSGESWMLMPYKEKTAWLPVESAGPLERLRQLGAKVSVNDDVVRDIDLTDSTITDAEMEIFNSLGTLQHLTLNGCRHLTDAGLVHLCGLIGLKGLGLERTNLTDAGLANLSGLTGLSYLSLNWTRVGDAGLRHLSALTNLEVLYLCDTNTADAGLRSLKGMSKLQWLDLRGTQVTDAGLAHLSNLSQLRLLSLHGIRMTDAGVPPLTELPNLEVLTLSQTQVTDAGLLPLTKLPKLKDLDLTGTHVTPAGIDRLKRALPDCQVRLQTASEASKPVVE